MILKKPFTPLSFIAQSLTLFHKPHLQLTLWPLWFNLFNPWPLCLTFLTPVMMSVLVLDGVLDLNFLFFNSLMAVSVTDSTPFIVTTSAVNTWSKASEKHMLIKKQKQKTPKQIKLIHVLSKCHIQISMDIMHNAWLTYFLKYSIRYCYLLRFLFTFIFWFLLTCILTHGL